MVASKMWFLSEPHCLSQWSICCNTFSVCALASRASVSGTMPDKKMKPLAHVASDRRAFWPKYSMVICFPFVGVWNDEWLLYERWGVLAIICVDFLGLGGCCG